MISAVLSVRSLLVAIFVLMAGNGFMATLLALKLDSAGVRPLLTGAVATAYFGGLTVGSLRVGRVVQRVGHIRAFAAFVSLLSATTLVYAIQLHPLLWIGLRLVDGLCVAGVYVCLESWLSDQAEPGSRGGVLASYMIALYGGQAVGQWLLNLTELRPALPFLLASVLISLSVLPVALTRMTGPALDPQGSFAVRRLYAISPLGVTGAAATGVMLGAFYGLGVVYARRLGLDLAATASFMTTVIVGGIALQWPLGVLSDRFERRRVITITLAGVALAAALLALAGQLPAVLLVVGGLFGGLSFALYPMCVAHTNDHLQPAERVAASGGLVLVYSAGAAFGPLLGAGALTAFGPQGLFFLIAACAALALAFALWRQMVSLPVPGALQNPFQILPRTTPMSAVLDPLAGSDAGEA